MNQLRSPIFASLLLLAAIIGATVLIVQTRPAPVQITILPPQPTQTPAPIRIYVTGAVAQSEQIISIAAGSRVEDAIAAAGGFRSDADRTRVNLAAILRDGDQVHVPTLQETASLPETSEGLPTPPGGVRIYINSATLAELQTLPGIGPAMAERILAHREANGPFQSLADLDAVEGIGPATLERLEPLLAFD